MDIKSAVARTEATQSQTKRDIVDKESDGFQRFTAVSPADISSLSVRNMNGDTLNGETNANASSDSDIPDICDTNKAISKDTSPEGSRVSTTSSTHVKSDKHANQKAARTDMDASQAGKQVAPQADPVPVNSIQFQADYRRLKADSRAFYQYFKVIICCINELSNESTCSGFGSGSDVMQCYLYSCLNMCFRHDPRLLYFIESLYSSFIYRGN